LNVLGDTHYVRIQKCYIVHVAQRCLEHHRTGGVADAGPDEVLGQKWRSLAVTVPNHDSQTRRVHHRALHGANMPVKQYLRGVLQRRTSKQLELQVGPGQGKTVELELEVSLVCQCSDSTHPNYPHVGKILCGDGGKQSLVLVLVVVVLLENNDPWSD
jgi:hypothetical protein